MAELCGFVAPGGERAYFFSGDQYWRFTIAANAVDPGYPLRIADQWPGLFTADIDAALVAPNGAVYFFSGAEYVRYDWAENRVPAGYPRPIAGNWGGIYASDIDACVPWPNGAIYLFQDDHYVRFEWTDNNAAPGYPRAIAGNWPGLFESGIDTALLWPTGKAYFFRGGEYERYDPIASAVDPGYPRPVAGNWAGLPGGSGGPAPTGSSESVRDYFPRFSQTFEGRVPWMYQDIKGLVTVAVGNLIDAPGAASALPFEYAGSGVRASRSDIEEEWRRIKTAPGLAAGGYLAAKAIRTLELSETSMEEIVKARYDADEVRLAAFYPEWSGWPADARLGAHSVAWAGAHFPQGWPNFNAAVNGGDWTTTADQSHLKDDDNPGVRPRNAANHTLFLNAGAVVTRGLDATKLYYPTAL